ncbi:MAG: Proton-conducting rane transporter [Chloroflexi bacterium]|nr:Proton-conducting rane transporter [Chloroflexota bacterium]
MSLLAFALVTTAAAAAAYATRNWRRAGTVVGFAGLLLTLLATLAIDAGERFEAAGGAIEATAYGRLFVLVGLVSTTLVLVIARLTAWQRNAPAAVLGGTVSLALALSSPEAAIGLLACGGAALIATLVALAAPLTPSRVRVLAREVRGAAVGLILGLAAVSLVPASEVAVPVGRVAVGLALLVAVLAVAQRLASIPFHARASRLVEAAPALGLPLLLAWIPAAWAVVLLDWAGTAIIPTIDGFDLERLLVASLAVATVVLGATAALAQDEIEKATAYAMVAGGSLVILAFASLDPVARDGMRAWLPAFVASAAGLAAWTIAIRAAFGTGRVDDLAGWMRRAPVLAVAFAGIGIALLGWPGAATWEGRVAVVSGVVGSPAPVLAVVAGVVPLLALVRLVIVGAGRPGPAAIAAPGERPRWGAAVLGPARGATVRQASPTESETGVDEGAGPVPERDPGARPAVRVDLADEQAGVAQAAIAGAGGSPDGRGADGASADAEPHEVDPLGAGKSPGSTQAAAWTTSRPTTTDGSTPDADGGAPAAAGTVHAKSGEANAQPTSGQAATGQLDGGQADADPARADPPGAGAPWRGRAGLTPGAHREGGRRLAIPRLSAGGSVSARREPAGDGAATSARYLLEANRVPIRAAVVLLLAVTTLLVAAGVFDLRQAAAEPPPRGIAALASAPGR